MREYISHEWRREINKEEEAEEENEYHQDTERKQQ